MAGKSKKVLKWKLTLTVVDGPKIDSEDGPSSDDFGDSLKEDLPETIWFDNTELSCEWELL